MKTTKGKAQPTISSNGVKRELSDGIKPESFGGVKRKSSNGVNRVSARKSPGSTKVDNEGLSTMRLQKFLARAGVASRRASETLITEGRVQVNGVVVNELGTKVDPARDEVLVDGKKITLEQQRSVLMLNKPAGYVTSMKDDRGRKCVADLVPTADYPGLFPIGRLDFDTTGLLLFSTDGELGNGLLHPSRQVDKVYEALVKGRPDDGALRALCRGVKLDDGMTAPATCKVLKTEGKNTLIELTIHEGRKRQVKRMCAAVGYPVLRLHRSSFGGLSLDDLKEGTYRLLSEQEVDHLAQFVS